ncbi:MAG: Gfo/Idh/MocA family oxidoreductase [Sedimentisphaerales bacterium]|nr:Gfo/Idh/MocA family oxidoreductase [Sedimentisphaerales bacterium]
MKNKIRGISRRTFLSNTAGSIAAFTFIPRHVLGGVAYAAPSDKLNIAHIGIGGQGGSQLNGCRGENTVALCDVDLRRAGGAFEQFPGAKPYRDFRKMFDEMEDKIDAVCVSTPDHTHAIAVMAAIQRGKHVYCEKPLAHSVYEIREIMKAAREHKVVTQLGNQGHSSGTIRTFCEWIWDGAIGDVHTIHAGCNANNSRMNQLSRVGEDHEIPPDLNWDLWLGPAPWRKYNPIYLPGSWRSWTPFGSGTIGDWICHVVDPVFWALDLGSPVSVQAQADGWNPEKHGDTYPPGETVKFEFAARGDRKPVTLFWFSGQRKIPRPEMLEEGRNGPETGAVVYGDKGAIQYGSHGAGGVRLIPESAMKAYKRPQETIPRVPGHHQDWLRAIKEGGKAGSNFDYGGPLTELAQLGIVAMKMLGQKLVWDGPNMKFTNNDQANKYLNTPYRQGWTL